MCTKEAVRISHQFPCPEQSWSRPPLPLGAGQSGQKVFRFLRSPVAAETRNWGIQFTPTFGKKPRLFPEFSLFLNSKFLGSVCFVFVAFFPERFRCCANTAALKPTLISKFWPFEKLSG